MDGSSFLLCIIFLEKIAGAEVQWEGEIDGLVLFLWTIIRTLEMGWTFLLGPRLYILYFNLPPNYAICLPYASCKYGSDREGVEERPYPRMLILLRYVHTYRTR